MTAIPAPGHKPPPKGLMLRVRVDEGTMETWREAAWRERVSVSELVRQAVGEKLERQAAPAISSPTSALEELRLLAARLQPPADPASGAASPAERRLP